MLRCVWIFWCVILLGGTCVSGALGSERLRVAVEDNYFPFSIKLADGSQSGFDVDLSLALCAQMQRDCQIIPLPFKDIIPAVQTGSIDIAVAGLAQNAEREKQLLYVSPYYRSRTALVGKAGQFYTSVDAHSMRGKRLAVQDGSVQHKFVSGLGNSVIVIAQSTVDDALQAVRDGKADIALADSLACMALLINDEGHLLEYVAEPLDIVHESSTAYIAVQLNQTKLAQHVKIALEQLHSSDMFNVITQKYFPFSIY